MKAKTILAAVFTAICWISLCLDWDLLMYSSGILAIILIWSDESKIKIRSSRSISEALQERRDAA